MNIFDDLVAGAAAHLDSGAGWGYRVPFDGGQAFGVGEVEDGRGHLQFGGETLPVDLELADQREAAIGAVGAGAVAAIAGGREKMLDVADFLQVEFVVEVADHCFVERAVVDEGQFVETQRAVGGY